MRTTKRITNKPYLMAALSILGMTMACTANAEVISGSSSGYGAYVDIATVADPILALNVSPIPAGAAGTAPAAYNLYDEIQSLYVSDSVCDAYAPPDCISSVSASVGTGLLTGQAASDVDGGSGVRFASATGTVNDTTVTAGTGAVLDLITSYVLGLSATTLSSSAQVSGDYGVFTPTGFSIIEGATLQVTGLDLITLDANAAANTTVDPLGALSLLGLTVVLNEQLSSCNAASCSIAVNALHLSFNDFAVSSALLNGEIIFGHSEASLVAQPSAVPVPAAAWLFGSGLAGLIGVARRRRCQ